MNEFTQQELEEMARDAKLDTTRTPMQDCTEVAQRICQANITKAQTEFEYWRREILDSLKPDLVQVTFVNAEMALPHMDAADELSDTIENEKALAAIEELRARREAIKATEWAIRDARIAVAQVCLRNNTGA